MREQCPAQCQISESFCGTTLCCLHAARKRKVSRVGGSAPASQAAHDARAGVSNFALDELAELVAMARIKPALVQRNSDPLSADAAVQAFCRLAGIQYQARPPPCLAPSPL